MLILYSSTYNKQWAEAQSALMDLLVQEMPAEPPKPERVGICILMFFKSKIWSARKLKPNAILTSP